MERDEIGFNVFAEDQTNPEGPLTQDEPAEAPVNDAPAPVTVPVDEEHEKIEFNPFEYEEEVRRTAARWVARGNPQKAAEVRELAVYFDKSQSDIESHLEKYTALKEEEELRGKLLQTPAVAEILNNNRLDAPIVKNDIVAYAEIDKKIQKIAEDQFKGAEEGDYYVSPYTEESVQYGQDELTTGDEALDKKVLSIDLNSNLWWRSNVLGGLAGDELGKLQNEQGRLWHQVSIGQLSPEDIKTRDEEIDKISEGYNRLYGDNWMFNAATVLSQMIHVSPEDATRGATKAGILATGAAGVAASLGMTGVGLPIGAAIAAGAVYENTRIIESGLALKSLLEQGIPLEKARPIAGAVGVFNGLVEGIGDVALASIGKAMIAPVKKIVQTSLIPKTVEALKHPDFLSAVMHVAGNYAKGVGTEVTTEVIQEIASITGEEVAKIGTDQAFSSPGEVADRLWDIAYQTFKGVAILGAVGAGPALSANFRRVSEAQKTKEFFETLNKGMSVAESKKIAPDVAAHIVQDLADNADLSTVYVDAQVFAQTLLNNNVSQENLRAVLPEVADSLAAKVANGELVEIPMGVYAQNFADTKVGQELTNHVKFSEEALSAAEAEKVQKETSKWIKEIAKSGDDPEKLQKLVSTEEQGAYAKEFKTLSERMTADLVASGVKEYQNVRKVRQIARIEAASVIRLARISHIAPENVMKFAPRIIGRRTQVQPKDRVFHADSKERSEALKKMTMPLNEWVEKYEKNAKSKKKKKAAPKRATFTPTLAPNVKPVILQNRNRNRPGLISQMNTIASKPDYGLVSFSRDFGNGAPVVAYGFVPENQLGKEDFAVTADYQTIRVRYAVVEAQSVMTSNRADGTAVAEYDTAPNTQMRAIAGNGRVAGLTEAYRRGTAKKYKEDLIADARTTGINPKVVRGMKEPILVRVMPADKVRPDIGDISNVSTTAELSALQRANNDANRIDLSKISFTEDGRINQETVLDFVRQMPESELDALITKDGKPTSQAYDRLTSTIIARTYQDDELTELLAESTSDEARNIFRALVATGPKFLRLQNTPMDMRAVIVQVAHLAVDAQRAGLGFSKYLTTAPFGIDPEVLRLARNIAETIRSSKETVAIFDELADDGYEVVNQMADQEEGLLGVQGGSLEDVWGNAQIGNQASVIQNLNDKIELRRNEAAEVEDTSSGALFQTESKGEINTEKIEEAKKEQEALEKQKHDQKERLKKWLDEKSLKKAKGKKWAELEAEFGRELEDIATIPKAIVKAIFGDEAIDNRVFTSRAYFLDHVLNHHGKDISIDRYFDIQEILENPDEVIRDERVNEVGITRNGAIFVKRYDNSYLLSINLVLDKDGKKLQIYKSLAKTKRKPYPQLDRVTLPVGANPAETGHLHDTGVPSKEHPAGGELSALGEDIVSDANGGINPANGLRNSKDGSELYQVIGEKGAAELDRQDGQARLDSLQVARDMESQQKTAKEIRLATGWERGADGKWRYEVQDGRIRTDAKLERKTAKVDEDVVYHTTSLGALYDSPELYAAYPELMDMEVVFQPMEIGVSGMFDGERIILSEDFVVARRKRNDARIAEIEKTPEYRKYEKELDDTDNIQDPIKAEQEFDRIDDEWANTELGKEYNDLLNTNRHEVVETGRVGEEVLSPLLHEIQHAIQRKEGFARGGSNERGNYRRQAGEVEARNVSNRLKLSPEQRRETLLSETQDVAIEDQNFLFQALNKDAANRGAYSPSQNLIRLTDNADLSTFAHEMSHWYLTNLFDLARNNPSSVLQDDVRAILTDWGLIKKEDQNDIGNVLSEKWDSLGFEGQRKYQERFAYQTEIYLATGKVPSGKLQTAFRNLGRWIRDVYRVWVGGVEQQRSEQYKSEFGEELPKLSDEVRRVMDRMLWSDEAIRRAEQIEGIRPLFDTKPDNMSEEEWEKQQKERFDALDEGANELLKAQAKDERWYVNARSKLLKEIQQNALEVREKERRKIAEKVFSSKEYKALDAIKNSAKKGVGDWRMDPKQLEASGFNEYAISRLKKAGLIREGGTSPAQVVDMLGVIAKFENAQELIKGLLKVSDVKALIQRETTRACLRKHSGLFKPKEIDASITKALQNDARARLVNTELRYLMNDKTLSDIVIRQTAKKAAEALINKTTIGKLRPRGLLAGQRRAARKSYEALMQGNKQLAAVYKRQQLVYMEASLIALDLQRQIDRVNNLKKIIFRSDKKLSKTYDVDLINVCRYILTNEGMGKVAAADYDPTTAEKFVENLAKYDEIRYTNLKPLLDKHCFDNRKFYDTTVARFRSTLEDVESVYAMAREAKQVTVEQKKVSVEEIVNTLLSQANALKGREPSTAGQSHTITAQERVSRKILAGFNLLKRAESWCNQMDVGNPNHPFRTFIYDPIAAAAARYRNTNAEFQGRLVNLLKPMIKDWKSKTNIEASEIKYTFDTKAELIAALLHTGNESNKRKLLLGGRGKDKAWATEEVDSDGEKHLNTSAWDGFVARCMANGTITKKDMDFVQAVWDLLEETKAQTQKAYKAMYGRYFKEVEASPVVTPFGVYRGGYVPAKVDQSLVPDAGEKNEANRIIENDFNFTMPVNDPGFAQSRVENYTKPLLLDIGSLCNHVDSVLRFAYLASACTDVAKVITDHEFRDYLDSYDASLVKDFLMPWVNRAYSQQIGDGKSDYVSRMANQLRSLAGINIMFGHVVNALQQVTGFSIAAQKVKPIYLLRAFKYLTSCRSTVADISALSDFMKSRFVDRSIEYVSKVKEYATISDASLKQKGAINKLYAIDRKLDPLRTWLMRNGYFVQTAMQTPIDAVVWMGAYQQAIDQGRTEQQAVMDADSVIRTTQSDFSPENISQIETGSALWRFFLVFYNYFNMQLNMLFEAGAQARQEKSLVKRYGIYTKAAVLTVIIPSAVAELIMQSLFNDLDTGDDDDLDALDLARIITSATAKDLLATAPIVGNIAQTGLAHLAKDKKTGAFSTVAQWMVGTDPYAGRILESPGIGLIKSSGNALKDAIEIANGEEVKAREAVRNFLDFASVMTRLPLGALKKPLGYGAGVLADEIHPEDELEAVAGFISGREKRKK